MKLRIASALMLVGAFLFCAAICSADSAPVAIRGTSKSSYGMNTDGVFLEPKTTAVSLPGGFSGQIDCSDVSCPGYLEIDSPNLKAGTIITITFPVGEGFDLNSFDSVFCFNGCVASCLDSISGGFTSTTTTDTFTFTAPACSLTGKPGDDGMALIFDDFGANSFPSLTVSTATPEPGLLMLLSMGMLGLWRLKRSMA